MRHSSSMAQSSSTGPSRKACSSAVSFAGGNASIFVPVGIAGEHVGVPPHVAGLDGLAFGGRQARQHLAGPAENGLGDVISAEGHRTPARPRRGGGISTIQCGGFEVPKSSQQARLGTSNPKPHWQNKFSGVPFASEVRIRICCQVLRTSEAGHRLERVAASRVAADSVPYPGILHEFTGQTVKKVCPVRARAQTLVGHRPHFSVVASQPLSNAAMRRAAFCDRRTARAQEPVRSFGFRLFGLRTWQLDFGTTASDLQSQSQFWGEVGPGSGDVSAPGGEK